jgi:hypothetical protein
VSSLFGLNTLVKVSQVGIELLTSVLLVLRVGENEISLRNRLPRVEQVQKSFVLGQGTRRLKKFR